MLEVGMLFYCINQGILYIAWEIVNFFFFTHHKHNGTPMASTTIDGGMLHHMGFQMDLNFWMLIETWQEIHYIVSSLNSSYCHER